MTHPAIASRIGDSNIDSIEFQHPETVLHGDVWRAETATPPLRVLWLHGWGQDRQALQPTALHFSGRAEHCFADIPGFGRSPVPSTLWGAKEYANMFAAWLKSLPAVPTIIVGHSVGGRFALQLAHDHPNLVQGVVLVAAHGLRKKRSPVFHIKAWALRTLGKLVTKSDQWFGTKLKARYQTQFGSEDYRNAGAMRPLLVKMANENMLNVAAEIQQPTLLIYAEQDDSTPVEFGRQYHSVIKTSQLVEVPGLDHITLLTQGKSQVQSLIQSFLSEHGFLS